MVIEIIYKNHAMSIPDLSYEIILMKVYYDLSYEMWKSVVQGEPCMNLLRHNSGTYHEHIISFDFRVLVVLSCHLKATSKKYRYVQQKVLMCDFFYTAVCRYVWAHLNSIPWRRRSLWRLSCLLFTNRLTIGLGIEVFHPCLVSLAQ